MQVFDVYTYNLKAIRFKDNKEFFDGLLGELGCEYTDVGFCFHSDADGSISDKAIRQFEDLRSYHSTIRKPYFDHRMSSISMDDKGGIRIHMDRDHIHALGDLLKKIPRPINFGFMGVILDHIRFDDNFVSNPCFGANVSCENIIGDHHFSCYYSNSIRFVKEFDYGNKLNLVKVVIEREGDFKQLAPLSPRFEEFCSYLGKPIAKRTQCIFNDEENVRWNTANETIRQLINKHEYDDRFAPFWRDDPYNAQGIIQKALDASTPIQGFSPKKAVLGIGKKHGFQYEGYTNGRYRLKKVNAYHHTIRVSFFALPVSSLFSANICACGYNFGFDVVDVPEVMLDSEAKMELYARKVFEVACEVEKKFTEPLFQYYGKTPGWYEA